MTEIERISNILKRQPVDRIGLHEHLWRDTKKAREDQGHIKENEETILLKDGNCAFLRNEQEFLGE